MQITVTELWVEVEHRRQVNETDTKDILVHFALKNMVNDIDDLLL